jgi:hypothetical protein
MDSPSVPTPLHPSQDPVVLPCRHAYCARCVSALRERQVRQVCPLCRAPLPRGSGDALYDDAARLFVPVQAKEKGGRGAHGEGVPDAKVLAQWSVVLTEREKEREMYHPGRCAHGCAGRRGSGRWSAGGAAGGGCLRSSRPTSIAAWPSSPAPPPRRRPAPASAPSLHGLASLAAALCGQDSPFICPAERAFFLGRIEKAGPPAGAGLPGAREAGAAGRPRC